MFTWRKRIVVRTRQAGEMDYPAVLKIQKKAFAPVAKQYKNTSIAPLNQTLEELTGDCQQGICLVAEEEKVIVGSVRARIQDGVAQINRLVVLPEFQNRGIGKALMHRIEAILRQQVKTAILFTDKNDAKNVSFYQSLGYLPCEEKTAEDGPVFVYMKKTIR